MDKQKKAHNSQVGSADANIKGDRSNIEPTKIFKEPNKSRASSTNDRFIPNVLKGLPFKIYSVKR